MKQALPPSQWGKYTPIGSIVVQILSTIQFIWLLQALAMLIECFYHGRYKADNYWESLNGAWYIFYFLFMLRKVKHMRKMSQSGQKMTFRCQMHPFHGFTAVKNILRIFQIFLHDSRFSYSVSKGGTGWWLKDQLASRKPQTCWNLMV